MKFTSVSEATSIINSANVSAYDITIDGNRGHSAIRSAGSSRVFIGKVTDRTDGLLEIHVRKVPGNITLAVFPNRVWGRLSGVCIGGKTLASSLMPHNLVPH